MQKTQKIQVPSLGQEDPLEKGMATHSTILAGEIPWTEEPGRLQSMGLQKSDMTERLSVSEMSGANASYPSSHKSLDTLLV